MIQFIANKLFKLWHIKFHWSTFASIFSPCMILSIMHWSFEQYWTTELCRYSLIWTHFIIISKNHMLMSPLTSSEKFTYVETVKIMVTDTSFPKFLFLLQSSNFIIDNKCYLLVLLEIIGSFQYHKNVCQITSLNNHSSFVNQQSVK